MPLISLGKVTVVTAGTPVRFSSSTINCNVVYVSTITGQAGQQMYVGVSGIVKATLANVLRVLQKPVATPVTLDSFTFQSNVSAGPIDLSTLFVDADTNGDAILVSYMQL